MTKQRIVLFILSGLVGAAFIISVGTVATIGRIDTALTISAVSFVILTVLLLLHLWGWSRSAEATIIALTLLTIFGNTPGYMRENVVISVAIPAVVAAALLSPAWTVAVFVATVGGIALFVLIETGGLDLGPTFSLINIMELLLVVGGASLASAVARHAQAIAEANAARATAALTQVEQQARNLEQQVQTVSAAQQEAENARSALLEQIETITAQREIIRTLSVPVLPLNATTLVMPLGGALDTARLQIVQEQALQQLERTTIRHLIIDITGVPLIDTQAAQGLIQVFQAARLLGTEVVLVGIRPELAQTIVGLGVDLGGLVTRSTLESGVAYAMR
jgi:rsbT co-antagonist protein RsbR